MANRQRRSLLDQLKKQGREARRRILREQQRGLQLEHLEPRQLLAVGPQLFAIRPDQGALLQPGDVLKETPREFNLLFKGGADINEATIASGVRLVRSGHDGIFGNANDVVVDLGYAGLNEPPVSSSNSLGTGATVNRTHVVLRPASTAVHNVVRPQASMPDDWYRIEIRGQGASALTNRNTPPDPFNDGQNLTFDFRLDLGAQVVSVAPQPVSRTTQQITIAGGGVTGTFTLSFGGQSTRALNVVGLTASAIQTALVDDLAAVGQDDVRVSGTGPFEVTFRGQYAGEQVATMGVNTANIVNGTVTVSRLTTLSQATDQIVVYFNNDDLNPLQAQDPRYYRLTHTNATLNTSDDAIFLPARVSYDAVGNSVVLTFDAPLADGTYRLDLGTSDEANAVRADAILVGTLFNGVPFVYSGYSGDIGGVKNGAGDIDLFRVELPAGTNLTVTATPDTGLMTGLRILDANGNSLTGAAAATLAAFAVPSAGTYYVEVSNTTGFGAYRLNLSVTGNAIATSDNNTTFTTATSLGTLGAATLRHSAAIEPQSIAMPLYPGGEDEPGHRLIQPEQHLPSFGLGPATTGAISTRSFSFPASVGGFPNYISEVEKQVVRQIYEVYSSLTGLQIREVASGGTSIMKGDLKAAEPTAVTGVGGVAGLGGPGLVVLDFTDFPSSNNVWGSGFHKVMFHEIGHAIGLGHSYDLPSLMGSANADDPSVPSDVLPGDVDVIHLNRVYRPDSTDIDLYRFDVMEPGRFTAEIVAERQVPTSLLDSVLTLFRQNADGSREVIARNDNYYSNDSFLNLDLAAGTYFLGVTSVGNEQYDPNLADSGFGGRTDGAYQLTLDLQTAARSSLIDDEGSAIDGDADGQAGGRYSFWFESSQNTIFVDKANDQRVNTVDGNGQLTGTTGVATTGPYDTISFAMQQAANRIIVPTLLSGTVNIADGDTIVVDDGVNPARTFEFDEAASPGLIDPLNRTAISFNRATQSAATVAGNIATVINTRFGTTLATASGNVVRLTGIAQLDLSGSAALMGAPNIVRIVGNGGLDGNILTQNDNRPYLIGLDNSGVPLVDGQSVEIPQGVTAMVDAGALLKLRKGNLDAGTSSALLNRSGGAIQILGTPGYQVYLRSFRDDTFGGDSDGIGPALAPGDFGGIVFRGDSDQENAGIFLNYVNHANIKNGGGKVFVGSNEIVFAPVHMIEARPTATFNTITDSADAAMSANPNSFDDAGGRIGPDISGNYLANSSINGLFVRIETALGNPIEKLTVRARFDDTDIPHVITENLLIDGTAGGPLGNAARLSGRLMIDPGTVVKLGNSRIELERGASNLIAEGTEQRPILFTSTADDRFGGSGTFDTNKNGVSEGLPGDWGGIMLNHVSSASIDHAMIAFGGGLVPIEGGFDRFNAIEVHQARLRLTNSLLQFNANGAATSGGNTARNGRSFNTASTIHVSGSQPVVINNIIQDNAGGVMSIDASAMKEINLRDYGRATGSIGSFTLLGDNYGPLVRLNRLDNNSRNGLTVREEQLTTATIWDDTDIVHILTGDLNLQTHHTLSGLRLKSSSSESLVVKLLGTNAGFSANGKPLEIEDRIGGMIHILGSIGKPVILTSLRDDSVGAGFTPEGAAMLDTNDDGLVGVATTAVAPQPGDWRSILLDKFSQDRNVLVVDEGERGFTDGVDTNFTPELAQKLGTLAPNEKSGDENSRLGFEINGFISPDDPTDVDVYSFNATPGTEVWFDIDDTSPALDAILELVSITGTVLGRSVDNNTLSGIAQNAHDNPLLIGDFYTTNFRDPSMRLLLPGTGSTGTYFVRVRSNPQPVNALTDLDGGLTSGAYRMQIRLNQVDEFPGSAIRSTEIRYATVGIDVQGLPAHSLIVGEATESGGSSIGSPTAVGNLFDTDRAAITIAGNLSALNQIDAFQMSLAHPAGSIQSISGVNSGGKTGAVVFDVDFADQAVKPDSSLYVFNAQGQLLLIGRESNVEDDRSRPGVVPDTTELRRGSIGANDPFIGPVHMPEGAGTDYRLVVSANNRLPDSLTQYYASNAFDPLFRLEPVNSVTRVVEDHIGFEGYTSGDINAVPMPVASAVMPSNPGPILDITDGISLQAHVREFDLGDVVMFVTSASGDALWTVNPFQGGRVTRVDDDLAADNERVQDLAIRSDGRFFGYQRLDATSNTTQNNVADTAGRVMEIDGGTGQLTQFGQDNVPASGTTQQVTGSNPIPTINELTYTDDVDAFTFDIWDRPSSGSVTYDVMYSVREPGFTSSGIPTFSSKLYRGNASGSAARTDRFGLMGDLQPLGTTTASSAQAFADASISGGVTFHARTPGAGGNGITINISTADVSNSINANPATGVISIVLDSNPAQTIQTLVDLINGNGTAGAMVTAAVSSGNAATTVTGPRGITLSGGNSGVDAFGLGPLVAPVTGLAYVGGQLFGVSSAGDILSINEFTGRVTRLVAPTGINFQGLSVGPQNVSAFDSAGNETISAYRNLLFAVAGDGLLHAFDTNGDPQDVFDSDGDDVGDAPSIDTGLNNVTGLAFSPLDFNLWHPTFRRGDDAGHGIPQLFDNSRLPGANGVNIAGIDKTEAAGGASFYFGLEAFDINNSNDANTYIGFDTSNAQYGIHPQALGNGNNFHNDLNNNPRLRNTYDFPGGASGSLVTNPFSLEAYASADKPTLYFNYFLNTESHPGSSDSSNGGNPFRDSARVFVSRDGGTSWELVATNNSQRSTEATTNNAELPALWTDSATEGLRWGNSVRNQQVQELFDNTGSWRQARIDLNRYAGQSDLRLRFDFSTAGAMNDLSLGAIDADFGEWSSDSRSIRGQANSFEGFYIDDIIVGFSERGEMARSVRAGGTDFWTLPQPPQSWAPQQEILVGEYQIEARRADDFAALTSELSNTVAIGLGWLHPLNNPADITLDTNERWVEGYSIVAADGASLTDGMTFTVIGRTTRVFEFNSTGGVATGNVAVSFTAGSTEDQVATAIRDAINGTADFGVLAIQHTATTHRISLVGVKNVILPGGSPLEADSYLRSGDSNRYRDQGQLIIENNTITQASQWAVEVTPGTPRGNINYPGAPINYVQSSVDDIAPGVVIQNNVIVASEDGGGIRFAGQSGGNAAVPFGRIVNNTIFGGTPGSAISQAADVIFLQDTTASMERDIDSIVANLLTMDSAMQAAGISVRYGAVRLPESSSFNGSQAPRQIQDITDFATFSAPTAPYPSLVNSTGGRQERGSEAILEALNRFDPPSGATTFNYTPGSRTIVVIITTENDDSVASQAQAITALQAANAVFFGIIDPNNATEGGGTADSHYRPIADATGGQILNIAAFRSNPSVFFDAFAQSLISVIGGGQSLTGISVESNASPTILNNVVAGFQTGITIAANSSSTVLGSNAYKDNTTNVNGASVGSSALLLTSSDPLFVNPNRGNFYPAADSPIVDSSLNALQDRANYVNFKTQLGIPQSPIFAPERDVYGQLRVDSVEDPLGAGSTVFKDRGAVDKADDERPYAQLLIPLDDDAQGLDLDPNATVVHRVETFLENFTILLGDGPGPQAPFQGTGINTRTVDIPTEQPNSNNSTVSQRAVKITANGRALTEGVDYTLGYNAMNNVLLLTPFSTLWEPNLVYEITLDNTLIQDNAGNFLRDNRQDGTTRFTIILGDFEFDYGDAPDVSYGTLLASDGARHVLLPDAPLMMGNRVDGDRDGQPTTTADGDDRDARFVPGTSPLTIGLGSPYLIRLPGGGASLTDGQSFTINDGINPVVTFTLDLNNNGVATGQPVPYFTLDSVARIGAQFVAAVDAAVSAGLLNGVTASYQGGGVLQIAGGSGLVVNYSGLTGFTVSDRLPLRVNVPGTGFADQQTFRLEDGSGNSVLFEFDSTAAIGLATGDVAVSFTPGDSANTIALSIQAAVQNAIGLGLLNDLLVAVSGSQILISPRDLLVDTSRAAGIVTTGDLVRSLQIPVAGATGIRDGQAVWVTYRTGGQMVEKRFEFEDQSRSTGSVGASDPNAILVNYLGGTAYDPTLIARALYDAILLESQVGMLTGLGVERSGATVRLVPTPNSDDEDGVTIGKLFIPSQANNPETTISIAASGDGFVDAWVDFNGNQQFDAAEKILDRVAVTAGTNDLMIDTSSFAVSFVAGETYARFRISAAGGLFPTSIGIGGEVEDYQVRLLSNAAPTIATPISPITVAEDAADATFNLNTIFADVDIADGNGDVLAFRFPNGTTTMTFQDAAGENLVTATISASGVMTLDYLQDQNGAATVQVEAMDHAGLVTSHSFSVTVTAVNDPPSVSLNTPAEQVVTIDEGSTPRVLTGILVNDVDEQETAAPNNQLQVTLSVPAGQGRLSVNATGTSATVTPAGPSESVTILGTEAAIDLILSRGVTYQLPNANFNNFNNGLPVVLTILANDFGRTGAVVAGTIGINTVTINVTPVNDLPVITPPPAPVTLAEGSAPLNIIGIAVDDADEQESAAPNNVLEVTLNLLSTVAYPNTGTLTVGSSGTATVTPSPDNRSVVIRGLEADIDAILLAGVLYTLPNNDFNSFDFGGPVQLEVVVNDFGSTGTGTPTPVRQTIPIDVTPVNDPPVVTLPVAVLNYFENSPVPQIQPTATIVDIDSPDFAGGSLTVDITVNQEATDQLGISINADGDNNPNTGINRVNLEVFFNVSKIGDIDPVQNGVNGQDLRVTLTSNATVAAVQALARAVTYQTSSDTPSTLARTVVFRAVDGDGGADTGTATMTINVTSVNDPPAINLSSTTRTYRENDPATAIDAAATVFEPDSANLNGGRLTVTITGAPVTDRLSLLTSSTPGSGIEVSGSTVSFNGNVIGTIDATNNGVAGVPLLIQFTTADATPAAVQALTRAVAFSSLDDNPTMARTVTAQLNDGTDTGPVATVTVNITPVNDPPVLTLNGPLNYVEDTGPVSVVPTATVTDPDSVNFAGGRLTVAWTANGTVNDQLSLRNVGGISTNGTNVLYNAGGGPVAIGTWSGGTNGTNLVVDLTSISANAAAVTALVRAVGYFNNIGASTATRTIEFRLFDNDGDDHTGISSTQINFTGVDDPMVVSLPGMGLSYTENEAPKTVNSAAVVVDVDTFDFAGKIFAVGLTINGGIDGTTDDRIGIAQVGGITTSGSTVSFNAGGGPQAFGTFVGGNGTPLVVTLLPGGFATPTALQALARALTFSNVSDNPASGNRLLTLGVLDGLVPLGSASMVIQVTPVNDAPQVTLPSGTLNYTENNASTSLDAAAVLVDPDSADLQGGTLTVAFTAGGTSNDQLSIRTVGGISTSGGNILYDAGSGASNIGTFTGGQNGASLNINLSSAAASRAAVQALLRAVAYRNSSDDPLVTPSRTVTLTLNDGDGNANGGADTGVVSLNLTVTAVNDAPVVTSVGGQVIPTINENSISTPVNIAALVGNTITDADSTNPANANDPIGIAIVAASSSGTWRYSIDGGTNWTNINNGALSATTALLLRSQDLLQFDGDDANGETATLTYHAWDQTGASAGQQGTLFNAVAAGVGGSGPFSSATDTARIIVTPVNDAPIAQNVGNPVLINAVDGGPAIQANFVANDVDQGETAQLVYRIVSQPSAGQAYMDGTPGDVVGGPGNSQFTFAPGTGFRDLAEGQVRQVTFQYQATDPQSVGSNLATVTITVTGVNDRPEISNVTLNTTEDGPQRSQLLTAFDPEGAQVVFTLAADVVLGSCAITPSVAALRDNFTQLGNLVTFNPQNEFQGLAANESCTVTLQYTANDQTGLSTATSLPATISVVVTGVNDVPVLVDDNYNTNEDTLVQGDALNAADVDVDLSDTLVVSPVGTDTISVSGAAVSVQSNGNFTYDPRNAPIIQALRASDLPIQDTFRVTVVDSQGARVTQTVTVTVTGVNDLPVANPDAGATTEDRTFSDNVLLNDSDPDTNETASLTVVPGVLQSTELAEITMGSNGAYTYDPRSSQNLQRLAVGEQRNDVFTYTVRDINNAQRVGTVTIAVTGVNDVPVANPDSASTTEDATVTINALSNDTDVDNGAVLSIQSFNATSTRGASITRNASGHFVYNPRNAASLQALAAGETVTDTFTYRVVDAQGAGSTGTVTVTVEGVNDVPVGVIDAYSTDEDTLLTINARGILTNDVDVDHPNSALVVAQVNGSPANVGTELTLPSGAKLTVRADGSLTYNPRTSTLLNGLREGETITELFIYLPADTMGVAATTATVTITVSGRNDVPTAVGESYSTSEDSLLNVPAAGLLANDSDVDQDTLQVAAFTGTSTLGVPVTVNANGSFSYDPRNVAVLQRLSAGESATDTIPYTIQDGNGGTASAIATITVTGVNDLPVATRDTYSIDEDSTLIVSGAGVLENDRDPDTNNVLEVIAAGATSNQDATVVFNPDGSRTYVFLTQLGAPVRLNSNGTFSFDPTMLPAFQNLAVGQTLVDRFVYTTGDGALPVGSAQAMVMITVEGRNDAPIVVNDLYTVAEDSQLVVAATNGVLSHPQTGDRDPEGSPISASLVTGPRHGQLSFTTAGGFTYTPNANFSGDDTFTYVARDGVAVSQPATVTIRVTGINDAPQAAADTLTVDQNSSLTLAAPGILSNDTDVDGETLSAVRVSGTGPSSGTLVLNASGALNYTPNPGFFGTDSFQYDAVDGGGLRSRATVTINVRNIHAWQNPTNRLDVTADGVVTSRDALLIINWLNANGSGPITPGVAGPPYRDVNGDDQVTPVGDVLPVINFLNNLAAGEAEGTVRVAVSGAGSYAGEGEGLGSSSLLALGLADLDAPLPGQNPFPPRPLPQPGTAARQVLSSRHDPLWSSLPSASANAEAHVPANSSSPIDAALEDTDLDELLDTIAGEIDSTWGAP